MSKNEKKQSKKGENLVKNGKYKQKGGNERMEEK